MSTNESLKAKFDALGPHLNERLTRLWATTEAIALAEVGLAKFPQQQVCQRKRLETIYKVNL
ncbi:hypothetical protein [Nostoc sp.]|uniref:hypothetical protein n=1 Tax=Nostoc sp. TaxID=1180 RepID=UPI002FF780C4